jgi:hypothetical protein
MLQGLLRGQKFMQDVRGVNKKNETKETWRGGGKKRRTELQLFPFHFCFDPDSRCEETAEEFGVEKGRGTYR